MNVARLVKQAPTLIVVACLGYASFSMESGMPEAAQRQAEIQKGLDLLLQDVVAEGSTAAARLEGQFRDPFWVTVAAPAIPDGEPAKNAGSPEADKLAEVVRAMRLEATFLQGRSQYAVIDGRVYSRGQRIAIPGNDPDASPSVQLLAVSRTGVLLKGGDKHYSLGYPDQLGKKKDAGESESARDRAMREIDPAGENEMLRRLLNSPLGAMGRGLIGDATSIRGSAGPAAKALGRQGSNPRARAPGAASP